LSALQTVVGDYNSFDDVYLKTLSLTRAEFDTAIATLDGIVEYLNEYASANVKGPSHDESKTRWILIGRRFGKPQRGKPSLKELVNSLEAQEKIIRRDLFVRLW